MLLVCPRFSPLTPLYAAPPNLQASPTPFVVHVYGSCVYILWLPYSLCFTLYPHEYLVNYQSILLNTLTFFGHPHDPSPIWQPSKHSLYLWFCFCSACLFWLFLDSVSDRHVFIAIHIFYLLFKEDPLRFHIILVGWWWTPLAFSCLGSSLYTLWF